MSTSLHPEYDCYENIIGLSKTECTCEDPKDPYELSYNTSESGLYIDELAPLTMIKGLEGCDGVDIWEQMAVARERAVKDFVNDAYIELLKTRKLKQNPWIGGIGQRLAKYDRAINSTYAGVHWFCKSRKGAIAKVTSINTLFNFTGNVTLWVYNNFNELLGTYVLNTVADTFTENDITDLELPLYSQWVDNVEYFFVYTLGANQPRDNTLNCVNCKSFRLNFSPNNPYYNRTQTEKRGWANYIMAGGFETDALEFETEEYGGSNYLNGLLLEAEFRCDTGELFCDDAFDFVADPLAISTAFAIRYKAAILLGEMIFSSSDLNFQSVINRDALAVKMGEWAVSYKENVDYIVKNTDIRKTDCFVCDDDDIMFKASILAT